MTATDRLFLISTLAAGSACSRIGIEGEGEAADGGGFKPTIAAIYENVFSQSCMFKDGCHTDVALDGTMALGCVVDGEVGPSEELQWKVACGNLLGVSALNQNEEDSVDRVDPGNAEDSYLIRKLEATDLTDTEEFENCPMPWNTACDDSDKLPQADIDIIRDWIDDGATDCPDLPPDVPSSPMGSYWVNFCNTNVPK